MNLIVQVYPNYLLKYMICYTSSRSTTNRHSWIWQRLIPSHHHSYLFKHAGVMHVVLHPRIPHDKLTLLLRHISDNPAPILVYAMRSRTTLPW